MEKDIPGYEGKYSVHSNGNVFSHISNKFLKSTSKQGWYLQVKFWSNSMNKNMPFRIHRLVAEAFLPNPNEYKDVNHKNGIKTDNRVDNLEWISRADNVRHAYRELGRIPITGKNHPKHRLILDLQTGIYYDCAREAAEAKGLKKDYLLNRISRSCRQTKNDTSLIFV